MSDPVDIPGLLREVHRLRLEVRGRTTEETAVFNQEYERLRVGIAGRAVRFTQALEELRSQKPQGHPIEQRPDPNGPPILAGMKPPTEAEVEAWQARETEAMKALSLSRNSSLDDLRTLEASARTANGNPLRLARPKDVPPNPHRTPPYGPWIGWLSEVEGEPIPYDGGA